MTDDPIMDEEALEQGCDKCGSRTFCFLEGDGQLLCIECSSGTNINYTDDPENMNE